ncbi:bifunctional DNA primase/polymerase [Nodosilinea sp. PGN35]|uniref:bifunctional DNA primase/polymerase n=1 Tax=Nodosilinea sp. PGN35 TaxID=3020489 RepID=UPI0023B22570|nr:bifunctional DNA primase/polymerase [Nodosilinea sp. TSF1-S3]
MAPAQDPTRYPARDRDGSLKRDKDGALMPAFTGKNPSYVDSRGIPHLIRHTQYQDRMPTQAELQTWFANPANGIGTLGGWHNIVWIDVDVKQFESQQACDQRIADWLSQYPLLQQTLTERTHSGGWRLAVRVQEKSFTNFSLNGVGGHHMGEALGEGRFTVLSPTVGPSGKAYVNVQRVPPVWVERLDAIGLYPVSGRREQRPSCQSRPLIQSQPAQPGVLRLEELATAKAQAVLHGDSPLESRSHSLTYALREFYGWENWATQNRVSISGNAEDLARAAGAALGLDDDRTERIIQSISDPERCAPAVVFTGGEVNAWKRVWKLDRQTYTACCPMELQQSMQADARQTYNQTFRQISHRKLQPEQRPHFKFQFSGKDLAQESAKPDALTQEFIQSAWWILANATQLESGESNFPKGEARRWVQGQTYRIETAGEDLVVQAGDRGIILKAQGNTVVEENLRKEDLLRFQSEVLRIRQQSVLAPQKPRKLSLRQEIELL